MTINIDGKDKTIQKQCRYTISSLNHFKVVAVATLQEAFSSHPSEMTWYLSVYIYKEHPLYEKASKNTVVYDLTLGNKVYDKFHCGCTYYHKNSDYIQIGCDYHHVGDEHIYFNISEDIPPIVEDDMKDLYEFFEGVCKK